MQISSMFRHWNINGCLCKDMQRLYFQQRNIEPQTVEVPSCPQRQASAWPSSWSRPGPAQTDWFSIDFYRMAFHIVPSKALDGSIKFHMKLTNSLTIKSEYRHHFAPTVVISQIGSTKIYQCSINNHAFPCPRTSIQTLTEKIWAPTSAPPVNRFCKHFLRGYCRYQECRGFWCFK